MGLRRIRFGCRMGCKGESGRRSLELDLREGLLIGTKSTALVTDAPREMTKWLAGTDEH